MKSNKVKHILNFITAVLFFMILFVACLYVSFLLVGLVFPQSRIELSLVPYYIASSILGLMTGIIFFLIIARIRGGFEKKNGPVILNTSLLKSIITTTEKISQGDFDVHLEHNIKEDDQLRRPAIELVQSVNNMAVGLNQAETMRQEFVTNVSHEIQSPLMSINGFTQALKNEKLSPEERLHYLNIIEAESMRLSRLSDNLIKLASLDSEVVKFEPKMYRLDRQIKKLVLSCEPQWSGKDIYMDISLDEESIKADEDLMSQVWMNLIHNSIKFTPNMGSVRIQMRRQDNMIEFRISDTGIGISKDDQLRIFERFYKTDKSRNRSVKGSGLGLSIAKKIVELHHGSISVQSELDKGSTFIVRLPAGL